ncbi:MAG: hypothetical protein QOG10_4225 [Kribbellaceae bacterium]|nr:hypothetical protein [Kribbellaceae bacterium]
MAWSDCLLDPVSCVAGGFGETAANSAWESFLKWMAQGLSDFSSYTFQCFSLSTTPRFDQKWWRDNLDLMTVVSLPILVAVFVLQCLSAVIRREPGRLGHAVVGALLGTAGVPLAVGIIASCGMVVDEVSTAILGTQATADGLKRMTDITVLLAAGTLGGFLLTAVILGLVAVLSLYFVMLIREVALIAFVVFAPIAMASWTWSATRHWLRRWIEVVGALLFSKIAMAVIFTLGISATGVSGQSDESNIGTFLAGILLVAMAAFAPLATFSFIHWAGDQGHAAAHALQQGSAGAAAVRDRIEQAQQWRADHFGGSSDGDDSGPVIDGDSDQPEDRAGDDPTGSGWSPDHDGGGSGSQESVDSTPPTSPAAGSEGASATAEATSHVSVDASDGPGVQSDSSADHGTTGEER